jgi:molybdopterin-containing oxidoreductase family molybdopterin binding subunit
MPETMSRRQFIKAGAAGTALVGAGAAGMLSFSGWIEAAEGDEMTSEEVIYSFHRCGCAGHCSLKCTVREGRLCLIEPNDMEPQENRFLTVCVRGMSEVQHLYSTHRIQSPLKRVGERGAGEFIAISWDEAFDILEDNIRRTWEEYGKDSLLLMMGSEAPYSYLGGLLGAQTGGRSGIDCGIGGTLDHSYGYVPGTFVGIGHMMATNESIDWVNSKTILLIGTNYLESSVATSRYFFEAKEAGAHIITVDPQYSTTAAKSHEWIPINPGTDLALALGMIAYVLDNKLYDSDFIAKNTGFTFLVNADDGSLLRDHQEEPDAEVPETGEANPYIIWDTLSNSAHPYTNLSAVPALEGTYTISGREYTTVFSLILQNQKQYTTDWAAEKTGIPANRIEYLAERYALQKPSFLGMGWGGPDKYTNSDILGHAAAILIGLTGNIGVCGGGVGNAGGYYAGRLPTLAPWLLPDDMIPAVSEMDFFDLPKKPNKIHAAIFFGNQLQQYLMNMNATFEWVSSLDFVAMCDPYHSSVVDWADLVLPACPQLENDTANRAVRVAGNYVLLSRKVVDPLGDSKPDFWIVQEIAKRFGLDGYLPNSTDELIRTQLGNSSEPLFDEITLERLIENKSAVLLAETSPRVAFLEQVYGTTSGKFEVYFPNYLSYDQTLPHYEEPSEAYAGNDMAEQYPLMYCNMRPKYFFHSQFMDATWIRQFCEPGIEMNPIDYEQRDLADGDHVKVFNDRGSFICKAHVNSSVRPGVARVIEGTWSQFVESGNPNMLTNNAYSKRGPVMVDGPAQACNDVLVEVKKVEA